MKSILISLAVAALLTGCHSTTRTVANVPAAPAKITTAKVEKKVARTPYDVAMAGETDMTWTPTKRRVHKPAPPKSAAKPYFVSKKRSRGRLFALPTK